MPRGHGIIINMSSYLPFVFTFNPTEMESTKRINYVIAPNIGGSHKKKYFSGFDSKEIGFTLICLDMKGPTGVKDHISYFEQLRHPDPGLLGIASSFFGNENYPPPQILLQFGVAWIPVVWDVMDVKIKASHFYDDIVRGIIGIPKKAEITLTLSLDEDHILNKANNIAEKAGYILGSAKSIVAEGLHWGDNRRKEAYSFTHKRHSGR